MARPKNLYLIVDTETATLPYIKNLDIDAKTRTKISIAKPLIYDIGWTICDRLGNIIKKENFLVQETFFVPQIFNTAYYKEKRSVYMQMLKENKIKADLWENIVKIFLEDLKIVKYAIAYNGCFDMKKAIPFTDAYITALYSDNYNEWEKAQIKAIDRLAKGEKGGKNEEYLEPSFKLRENEFPMIDLWGLACERLINANKYKDFCLENNLLTASGVYFKTSAETAYKYLMEKYDFVESHTALDDAEIETQILAKALKKGKLEEPQVKPFPFRELGDTVDYVCEKKPKYIEVVKIAISTYAETLTTESCYTARINNLLERLTARENFLKKD